MKIVVAVRQVPVRDSALQLSQDASWIQEDSLSFEMNEPDAYALEEALHLKEQHGGEVVLLSAGPERVATTLREGLAKGADRAIHIAIENVTALSTLELARALAAEVQAEKPDLVLTGLQSDDVGSGQTGVVMAELLDVPHATIIMQVEMDGAMLRVKRELEDGWFQHVRIPTPALLTIQSGIRKLRYATLMGIKKARTKEIRSVSAATSAKADFTLEQPKREKKTQMISGDAAAAAAALVHALRNEARVI
jgi:electron transfer flavoprotein beta subunit